MLDISKAYDCIDYNILQKSLKTQGQQITYAAGGKKDIKMVPDLRLIRNNRDGSCSRIKSKLFTVYVNSGDISQN